MRILIFKINNLHEAVKIENKKELFNNKQRILICRKGKQDLPIIQITEPISIYEIEEKAIKIASFLKVTVKS